MGIKELSLELAAVSLIADEAKKAKDRLRAALQTEMDKIGADRVKAEYGDDVIAYVTTSKPKFKWIVKNEREFVKWVKSNIFADPHRSCSLPEINVFLIWIKFSSLTTYTSTESHRLRLLSHQLIC